MWKAPRVGLELATHWLTSGVGSCLVGPGTIVGRQGTLVLPSRLSFAGQRSGYAGATFTLDESALAEDLGAGGCGFDTSSDSGLSICRAELHPGVVPFCTPIATVSLVIARGL